MTLYKLEQGGYMIITDRIRRDILSYLEKGYSKSKVLSFMIRDYNLYDGFLSQRFLADKAEMKSAIAAVEGKRSR